jgi:hypothetical protein
MNNGKESKNLFQNQKPDLEKSGRPPQDLRAVLNGILWILSTGAPPGRTCPNGIRPKALMPVFLKTYLIKSLATEHMTVTSLMRLWKRNVVLR